jgi:hypothetical protein
MGNLGNYQRMTQLAKQIGGPLPLAGAVALGGWIVIRVAEAGFKGARMVRRKQAASTHEPHQIFVVGTEADCGAGLTLHVGEEFRVLERDGNVVLIEVLGNADNPYFVSAEILARVSDFPA